MKYLILVVLAVTCLHEAYAGQQHPEPDPFLTGTDPVTGWSDLDRALELQRQRFDGLVDRLVPIDLTKPEDGFLSVDFGGQRLRDAMIELLPAAYRQTFISLDESMRKMRSLNDRRAMPYVVSYSILAATAAAAPVPWIDIPLVVGIQTHLVMRLRALYGAKSKQAAMRTLATSSAARLVARLVVRGPLKAIPLVGIAASSTLAFAYTYGLGKACCWYFGQV